MLHAHAKTAAGAVGERPAVDFERHSLGIGQKDIPLDGGIGSAAPQASSQTYLGEALLGIARMAAPYNEAQGRIVRTLLDAFAHSPDDHPTEHRSATCRQGTYRMKKPLGTHAAPAGRMCGRLCAEQSGQCFGSRSVSRCLGGTRARRHKRSPPKHRTLSQRPPRTRRAKQTGAVTQKRSMRLKRSPFSRSHFSIRSSIRLTPSRFAIRLLRSKERCRSTSGERSR